MLAELSYAIGVNDTSPCRAKDSSPLPHTPTGLTLPTVKRFSPTSGIGKPAVNRRKPLETARNDNSNSKTGNRCLPTGNRCLPTGNRRF